MYHLYGYTDALCNDGSVGGFYYAPWTDPAKQNLWLVYLEGGSWCYSNSSCAERKNLMPELTTSNMWWWKMAMGGIFDKDPKRNPFAGANLVYVGYCSSDAWVGNVGAGPDTFGWHFRGQRIIEATFQMLARGVGVINKYTQRSPSGQKLYLSNTTTYRLTASDKVLFGGCSAGSRGAMFTVDYVQPMLPPGSPPVLAFFDSPMWVDVEPVTGADGSIISLEYQTQQIYALVNATARLGDACAAAYPGEGWKCLYGQYRLPFVETPYLVSASQFDKYQLPYNEGGMPPYNPSQLEYAASFQDAVRTVMLNLPTSSQPRSAVFSSACFKHCTSSLAWGSFWGVKVGQVSLRDYLGAWYFGGGLPSNLTAGAASLPPGLSKQHIEACSGFGCGQCHRKPSQVAPAPPLPPAYTLSLYPTATRSSSRQVESQVVRIILFMAASLGLAAAIVWRRMQAGRDAPGSQRVAIPVVGGVELGQGPFVGGRGETAPLLRREAL